MRVHAGSIYLRVLLANYISFTNSKIISQWNYQFFSTDGWTLMILFFGNALLNSSIYDNNL